MKKHQESHRNGGQVHSKRHLWDMSSIKSINTYQPFLIFMYFNILYFLSRSYVVHIQLAFDQGMSRKSTGWGIQVVTCLATFLPLRSTSSPVKEILCASPHGFLDVEEWIIVHCRFSYRKCPSSSRGWCIMCPRTGRLKLVWPLQPTCKVACRPVEMFGGFIKRVSKSHVLGEGCWFGQWDPTCTLNMTFWYFLNFFLTSLNVLTALQLLHLNAFAAYIMSNYLIPWVGGPLRVQLFLGQGAWDSWFHTSIAWT